MRLNEVDPGGLRIAGYGNGGFRIGEAWHDGAVLILPGGVRRWDAAAEAPEARYAQLLEAADGAELVILGTGDAMAPLPPPIQGAFAAKGIGAEAMATPSACRTFNVLLAEGRRVAAALLPVS